MTREQVLSEYREHIVEDSTVDPALATDMGDYIFLARFSTWDEVLAFYSRVLQER